MGRRLKLAVLIPVAFALLLLLTNSCTLSPVNQVRARRDLGAGFPDFRLTQLRPRENWSLVPLDSGGMATYEFTLESKDVEGFKLKGTYYLEPRPEEQDKAIRGSMFSGESLSREELAELERLWVKLYPSKPIFVGVDTLTGPIVDHPSSFLVEPPYRGLSDADVYGLTSAPDTEFFRLDRQNGNWEHLPGFVEPRS